MGKSRKGAASHKPLTVLLVEGPTEVIFYERVKRLYLGACRVVIEHIEGNFNVNGKILNRLTAKYCDCPVRAYCCLDRESRYAKVPALDLKFIRRELADKGAGNILSVDAVIATQMIESWFFHDIDGIFNHLRVPRAERKPRKWHPPERLRVWDLKELFRRYGKMYCEGERARGLIEGLDMAVIVKACRDLRDVIDLIRRQGGQ